MSHGVMKALHRVPALRVAFKVPRLDASIASVRYRCLFPAAGLRSIGFKADVMGRAPGRTRLSGYDCIVFVKPTGEDDLRCAKEAATLSVPIVLDICDDVFLPAYGKADGLPGAVSRSIMDLASAVTTTGPVLVSKLQMMVGSGLEVIEVPDPFENETDNAAIRSEFSGELRAAWTRLQFDRITRRVLARGSLLRAPLRAWNLAMSVPLAEWPRRLPGAIARRIRRNASRPAAEARRTSTHAIVLSPWQPPPTLLRAAEPTGAEQRKVVVWFGSAGAAHGDFGIRNLRLLAEPLARVATTVPLTLLVISNSRGEFERVTAGFPFNCEYREWGGDTVFRDLDEADVCVIPNSRDPFSIGKSANRHALALSRGVPVVATSVPAVQPLAPFLILDTWEQGIRTYLTDPERRSRDVAAGRAFLQARYSLPVLASAWAGVIQSVSRSNIAGDRAIPQSRKRIIAFMDLVQDLDILLPILRRLQQDNRFALSVYVTDWLHEVSPRVARELLASAIVPQVVTKKQVLNGATPDLTHVDALITASESSHPAHRVPFALVRSAAGRGIPTYTLQHGLENIGLTYFDSDPEHDGPIRFGSSRILTWGPVDRLPSKVQPAVRARCVGVGSPKPVHSPRVELPLPVHRGLLIGVFENLHWNRYPETYRLAFARDLRAVAAARSDVLFLLKPHHAGLWLVKNRDVLLDSPENILLADPTDRTWEPFTSGSIVGSVDAVVTTPSTVALDAARAGRPVAVLGYGLDLPVYHPLSILEGSQDWLRFIEEVAQGSGDLKAATARFCRKHVIEGDSVGRIIDSIAADTGLRERAANSDELSGASA